MFLIRCFEEQLLKLFAQGQLMGTTHTCIGQEPCAVGVIEAIDGSRDIVLSNHRGHGHFLAYCDDVEGLLNEVCGRPGGVCGGIGGSQHLHKNNFYSNGILGGMVAVATGIALAEKVTKSGAISVVFLGDGAMGEGVVYEAMNIASLWSLPILFVLEHNRYAQTTPSPMQHSGDLSDRAATFLIESETIDASNVMEVYKSASAATSYVRNKLAPFFLTLNTYRLAPHSKGDDFRPKEELEFCWDNDPLKMTRKTLISAGIELSNIESQAHNRIQLAIHNSLRVGKAYEKELLVPKCA